MEPRQTANNILSRTLAQDVDHGEVYLLSSRATNVEVKEQKIDAFVSADSIGAGLRVYKGSRVGFSFVTLSDGSEIDILIKNAVDAAFFTEPDSSNVLPAGDRIPDADLHVFDPALSEVTEAEKIDRAMVLEKSALDADDRIKVIRKAAYGDSAYTVSICNSKGLDFSYDGTSCSSSIMLMADDGKSQEMGWDSDADRFYSKLDVEAVGRRAAENAVAQLGARQLPTVKVPVLFPPLAAVSFLEVLVSAFSANAVQKGKSLFKDRVGDRVASSLVTLIDDGLMPGGLGSAPVDDEGVPMKTKSLIDGGTLRGYLHNAYTAAKDGVLSTGNGVRSGYASTPHVGPTNLYVKKGDR
jgi:PmbA protein